jgi:hypothetical protein
MRFRALAGVLLLGFSAQDPAPPEIVSVRASRAQVVVVFSKPVEKAAAEKAEHYGIEPAVKVASASRGMDLCTVTLAPAGPLAEGMAYTLSVTGVTDCQKPPNPVAPGTKREFTLSRGIMSPESPAAAPKARVNHAGRPLPPLPKFKAPVMFNTPEADDILDAMQVFPKDNPWNEDISKLPVHPDSDRIIRNVGADTNIHVDVSENFILIPPDQSRVDVKITTYKDVSDKGPFPMPENAPIQGWGIDNVSLEHIQRVGDGDRHILLVDPHNAKLYEFYQGRRTDAGWEASIAVVWDLTSNKTRPKNWTSADAAGLALFPGSIKFHEIDRGRVEHAIRLTVSRTRKAFIYPATHLYAGHTDDPCFPAMGQRFRLKESVDISKMPRQAMPIAVALKKYGMIVADNGRDWDLCATPDKRIIYDQMRALHKLKGSDFEVVVTTGEKEGPRAAGGGR